MSTYFTVNIASEFICAAIGCYCLANQGNKSLHLLWGFPLFICLAELTGIYIKTHYTYNVWFYNLLLLFQLGFFSYVFHQIFSRYFNPTLLIFPGIGLVLLIYGYDLYSHGFWLRHKQAQTVFGLLMTSYSLYFFYLLLAKDDYIALRTYATFWWVAGTLFYFFAVSVINIFSDPLTHILTSPREALSYTYKTLNIILYGCWSYSFICKRWEIRN